MGLGLIIASSVVGYWAAGVFATALAEKMYAPDRYDMVPSMAYGLFWPIWLIVGPLKALSTRAANKTYAYLEARDEKREALPKAKVR